MSRKKYLAQPFRRPISFLYMSTYSMSIPPPNEQLCEPEEIISPKNRTQSVLLLFPRLYYRIICEDDEMLLTAKWFMPMWPFIIRGNCGLVQSLSSQSRAVSRGSLQQSSVSCPNSFPTSTLLSGHLSGVFHLGNGNIYLETPSENLSLFSHCLPFHPLPYSIHPSTLCILLNTSRVHLLLSGSHVLT